MLAKIIRAAFMEFNAPKRGTVYSDPTTDDLFGLFRTPRSILWVAEEQSRVLGCCGVYPTKGLPGDCAEIVKFYLAAEARGKGTGKKLLEKSIDSAVEMGYSRLYLESLPQFSTAVSMYYQFGFVPLNEPMGISGHSSCNIWMLKTIEKDRQP